MPHLVERHLGRWRETPITARRMFGLVVWLVIAAAMCTFIAVLWTEAISHR
jgi:hypothetical protein